MFHSIQYKFLERVKSQPLAPAIIDGQATYRYRDLAVDADGICRTLQSRGCRKGTVVAILANNSPNYVASYYGILAAGGVVAALNTQERPETWLRQLIHCGAKLLITDKSVRGVEEIGDAVEQLSVETLGSNSDSRYSDDINLLSFGSEPNRDALASIIYTSGTTGEPKGIMLSHGNLAENMAAICSCLPILSSDRCLAVLPFYYSFGNSVMHTHLAQGACLVLQKNIAFPQQVLETITNQEITSIHGVPVTFSMLFRRIDLKKHNLSSLRYLAQAGGPMSSSEKLDLRRELPGTQFYAMYGQTEATARLTCLADEDLLQRPDSVGKPIPGVEISVRNENGDDCSEGQVGEIWVKGPNVMLGYWKDDKATNAVVRNGWLRTGDLGFLDADRFLYISGRANDMIKTGANRVFPAEIEEVIAAFPEVAEVAVVGVPDPLLGEKIVACIIKKDGREVSERTIQARCLQKLATFKVPKEVRFTKLLPRTASGKLQRNRIAVQLKEATFDV